MKKAFGLLKASETVPMNENQSLEELKDGPGDDVTICF